MFLTMSVGDSGFPGGEMATQNGPTNLLHWRIQGGARDALSKFFHFHAVFGKKFAKYYVFIVFIPLSGVAPPRLGNLEFAIVLFV